jgi:hypothetical protein
LTSTSRRPRRAWVSATHLSHASDWRTSPCEACHVQHACLRSLFDSRYVASLGQAGGQGRGAVPVCLVNGMMGQRPATCLHANCADARCTEISHGCIQDLLATTRDDYGAAVQPCSGAG